MAKQTHIQAQLLTLALGCKPAAYHLIRPKIRGHIRAGLDASMNPEPVDRLARAFGMPAPSAISPSAREARHSGATSYIQAL